MASEKTKTTAFITKYALSRGIETVSAEYCGDDMIKVEGKYLQYFHKEGRDWHTTMESAKIRAEEMRKKKINSLQKSIKKLENIKF